MAEKWYEGLPDDSLQSETEKAYERAEKTVLEGLAAGLGFDAACAAIDVQDEGLRVAFIDDMLKVIIAEEHFSNKAPLDELAGRLKVPVERLKAAEESMLAEVEEKAIREFHRVPPRGTA